MRAEQGETVPRQNQEPGKSRTGNRPTHGRRPSSLSKSPESPEKRLRTQVSGSGNNQRTHCPGQVECQNLRMLFDFIRKSDGRTLSASASFGLAAVAVMVDTGRSI